MNAYQPRETQTYGYDNTCLSFEPTGTLIFGYDPSANCFITFNFGASPGAAVRLRQFTGKERDAESGLDYFGARYYGSGLGRWTSPDSYNAMAIKQNMILGGIPESAAKITFDEYIDNPQNWNAYNYVRNSPLALTDPTGSAPAEGHHLIPLRNLISSPLGRSFANAIRTGPLSGNGFPNQPGFLKEHVAYNKAVEEIMSDAETVAGNRNSWSLSQWEDVANKILSSSNEAIKSFLDTLEENNPGAKAALGAALSSYRVPLRVVGQVAAQTVAGDLGNFLVIFFPAPVKSYMRRTGNQGCLLDRASGACAVY